MTANARTRELVEIAAAAADSKGAEDLVAFDVSDPLPLVDAFLPVSYTHLTLPTIYSV